MKRENFQKNNGFTIIETMIAISLFLVVVMYGMNALLHSTVVNKKSQDMRSIMDNLSFAMEDISRNLRTGTSYHCVDDSNYSNTNPHSCINGGRGISFKSSTGNQMIYKIDSIDGGINYSISESDDGGTTWVNLTSTGIKLNSYSGFYVSGAEAGDDRQPMTTIKLIGKVVSKNVTTPFSIETSISQRTADSQ